MKVNFDLKDPISFGNETLNIKEFDERYHTLMKTETSLSPKSLTEFSCLSQYMESYKNGKLNGQTIQINRLNSDTAYYYVKIPQETT